MQLLVAACALLVLASASAIVITEEAVDKKDVILRYNKQTKSALIDNGQCSGSVPEEWLSCPLGLANELAFLKVTVEDKSQVSLNMDEMEKVYIFRSEPCVGVAHVRLETQCTMLVGANTGDPLPEVPRSPRQAALPLPEVPRSPRQAALPLPEVPHSPQQAALPLPEVPRRLQSPLHSASDVPLLPPAPNTS